jgi:hypothetical protein
MGVHAVFIRIPVDADRSIGMRRMPTTESVNIMMYFNELSLMSAVAEGVSAGLEVVSSEVSF